MFVIWNRAKTCAHALTAFAISYTPDSLLPVTSSIRTSSVRKMFKMLRLGKCGVIVADGLANPHFLLEKNINGRE